MSQELKMSITFDVFFYMIFFSASIFEKQSGGIFPHPLEKFHDARRYRNSHTSQIWPLNSSDIPIT